MDKKSILKRDLWIAKKRIAPYISHTQFVYSHRLSQLTGAAVYLKFENMQEIGAFKIRGAANKILSLTPEEQARGVSTFSTGNHGMAVACMAQKLGMNAIVCMSRHVPQVKVEMMKRWNPTILQEWDSQDAAGEYCYQMEKERGIIVIPPFDDKEIICGQATMAIEMLEDQPLLDTVLVPLSGGGLISGVALGMKLLSDQVKVVGISMERSAVMIESLKAGHPIELPEEPTLADSLLGGIGLDNQYTFDIVRDYVDETAQVSETEIADGMAYIMEEHKMIVEGASAVGVAYAMRPGMIEPGSHVGIAVTGRGVSMDTVEKILEERYRA